ncbi:DNA-directed RNA polymerase III subunit RPC8 [Lamellibrachia satsuma]|nr:DNA-directed RNA polymerase III subunit RPC8 [Lamellibrachia satsuma]
MIVNVLPQRSTMFILSKMKDTVKIPPWQFNIVMNDAIVQTLNKKFANKVVHNVGLCIALWDVTKIEDSYILPGDGSSHTIVHFRYIVFRPFMDEIVVGKIRSSSKEGVHVSLGFFDDILIPPDALQHPSRFHPVLFHMNVIKVLTKQSLGYCQLVELPGIAREKGSHCKSLRLLILPSHVGQ